MARRTRSFGVAAAVALLALFALTQMAAAAPRAQETKNVNIKDFKYDPAAITVNVGDTIVWTNSDEAPHTATAADKSFDTGRLNTGQTGSVRFEKAGTFEYVCTFHDTMRATIEVMDHTMAAPAQQAPTGSLDAADQPLANRSITVASITAGQDGWVVAHLDEAGRPGKVLGQTAVKAGTSTNVVIALSEDVPVGGALWPMLHIDAGTVGTYEFPGADAPVVSGGAPVMKKIMVTAAAAPAAAPAPAPAAQPADAVEVADQPVANRMVTVALVRASQDGWIVVHLDEAGRPGKVLGQTAVKAGENRNVQVALSEDVPAGGALWPMLHVDAGAVGTYEFPGADAPVRVGDQVVMKKLTVTAAAAPAALPRTAGEDGPLTVALLGALLALLAGAALRTRRA